MGNRACSPLFIRCYCWSDFTLSDGSLQIMRGSINARLEFEQSLKHFPYFRLIWYMLAPLCQSIFRFRTSLSKGTPCYSIKLYTRCLPFLTELYHLFYVDGIKVIPDVGIMYDLLTPEALAHWIMAS
jgi:hypothetical protein